MKEKYHPSAMISEIEEIASFLPEGGKVVDATLGDGGHSKIFLEMGFRVIAIDMDETAIKRSKKRLSSFVGKINYVHSRHSQIEMVLNDFNWGKCDILFADLGARLDQLYREDMSFNGSKRADMRFDKKENILNAEEILASYNKAQLMDLFKKNDVKNYRKISEEIISNRGLSEKICKDLSSVLSERSFKKNNPATKAFMALRREVNKEEEELKSLLSSMLNIMESNGISIFLTWHSGEDKLVKNFYKKLERMEFGYAISKKPMSPTKKDIEKFPQIRSAKLRAFKFN